MIMDTGGGEFEATPENTSLFSYAGKLAIYDHVFFVRNNDKGIYLFNQHPVFADVADYIIENDYPMHLFLRNVAQCDIDAFNQMVHSEASDLDKGVPDDWS